MQNKVAIVTGSSRGIGRAIAVEFAKNGANVVINHLNNDAAADETKKILESLGVKTIVVKANVSIFEECEKMVTTTLQEFGRVDVLVNNAGIVRDNLLMMMSEEEWNEVVDTSLKGTFNCTKAIVESMGESGGSIINITSIAGVMGNIGQVNYSAAKAGVIGMTKTLAKELISWNIRVNAIAPGFIATDMSAAVSEKARSEIISKILMKRLGEPVEVANLAVFLASDLASYITGQVIGVDGGMTL